MQEEAHSDMPSTSIQELAAEEITRLTRKGFQWLGMPAPLEASFESSTRVQRSNRLWMEGLIAIALYNVYVLAGYFLRGGANWFPVQMRLCIITPIAILINVSMKLTPSKVYRETSIAVVSCLIGLTHLYLESGKSTTASAYAQVGLMVVVIFVNVVMRLQFSYAVSASAVLLAGDLAFLWFDRFLDPADKLLGVTLALCATIMTVVANYSVGREERVSFLMRLRTEIQSRELIFLNLELQRLSSIDSLTGLANRHAYEAEFEKLWLAAVKARECFSAIVIDIDHFKSTNDASGHLYGDRVLARVASLLAQSLRCKDDFAARFGGEEFVVLLPGTDREGAMLVAERMRKLIEVAGSPALDDSGIPPRLSTVSCGVSTCWPNESIRRDDLVDAADKALYRAKAAGRNCVTWGDLSSPARKQPAPDRSAPDRNPPHDRPSGTRSVWARAE